MSNGYEIGSGLRKVLTVPFIYRFVQSFFGEQNSKEYLIQNLSGLADSEPRNVLDIGCGPGNLIEFLPEISEYVGFDISEPYIASAKNKYTNPTFSFYCGSVSEIEQQGHIRDNHFTDSLVHGVFHHVDDEEIRKIVNFALDKLKPGGQLLILEPVWHDQQRYINKKIMGLDRGQNIKPLNEWKTTFDSLSSKKATVQYEIKNDLIRFYDLIIVKMTKI